MIVFPLKEWKKVEKEMAELKDAMEAIIGGEADLREGRIRPFKKF